MTDEGDDVEIVKGVIGSANNAASILKLWGRVDG
jgi:hypothetical protein